MIDIDNALRIAKAGGGPRIKTHKVVGSHKGMHTGPIHSNVAGRTDHLPMHVPSGSYVVPADIVSGMGEGNTMAGYKHLRRMFSGNPYGNKAGGPYGQGSGTYSQGSAPYGKSGGPYDSPKAGGGAATGVPIVAAGGEHVLTPDEVRMAGNGDLDVGHKVLDAFVIRMRKELIHTLKHLAGPKKD